MALATEATGDRAYAESAMRDLRWVIANRLEKDGGLEWRGPEDPFFFEVHQEWFLISSELTRRAVGYDEEIRPAQRRAWRYLLGDNPAGSDFYTHNRDHHGPMFGYRSVDRSGVFQSQGAFKGSYEAGAALWAMSLHRGSTWLSRPSEGVAASIANPASSSPTSGYLAALASQVSRSARDLGFVDPAGGLWVRSILWNGNGWSGAQRHDWKYSLHMQEGALLYQILTGETALCETAFAETENLVRAVREDGTIPSIPDNEGSPAYEYGEALSVLALSAIAFYPLDADLSGRSIAAGRKVARVALERFVPEPTEDGAVLLIGFCRIAEATASRDRSTLRLEAE